jgi:prevent-host-death family protein
MTAMVNVHDAKTHFSKLLARVEAGEQIVIARAGKPIAVLSQVDTLPQRRIPGNDAGLVEMKPDFDLPLPEFQEFEE